MTQRIVAIATNSSWNIVNFRMGLVEALHQHGYQVVALSPPDEYSSRLASLNVGHIPISVDSQGLSPWRDLRLLYRYWRELRRLRPSALLCYTAKPNVFGSLAAHALRVPVINNISGLGTVFIKGGFLLKLLSALYRMALRSSAMVFFQNQDDHHLFRQAGLIKHTRTKVIPGSGINLKKFDSQPARQRQHDDIVTFLFVGRLIRDKGIEEYVEAARIVRAGVDARFQVLGFLEVDNATAIPRSVVTNWVEEGLIEYLGSSDDVRPAMAAADCVVLPSYREGLPRVLLEGGALHKPLVATDVPGCREVVMDGENGFLCTVRDSRSLADAMLKIATSTPHERARMGQAARNTVETRFDEKLVIQSYISAIEEQATRGA